MLSDTAIAAGQAGEFYFHLQNASDDCYVFPFHWPVALCIYEISVVMDLGKAGGQLETDRVLVALPRRVFSKGDEEDPPGHWLRLTGLLDEDVCVQTRSDRLANAHRAAELLSEATAEETSDLVQAVSDRIEEIRPDDSEAFPS